MINQNLINNKHEKTLHMLEKLRIEGMKLHEEEVKREKLKALLSKVPARFIGKKFEDYRIDYEQQAKVKTLVECYIKTFDKRLQDGSNLIFLGKPGTGKTFLALILYQVLVNLGYQVEYHSSISFIRLLQEKQFESHNAFGQIINFYKSLPLLIIDEVTEGCGKGAYPADWERNLLRVLIDTRYQSKRSTIVISNRSNAELIDRLGEPSIDRLTETGATLVFDWPSYRRDVSR